MIPKPPSTEFKPCGLPTGIGSLPFIDPKEAIDLIFSTFPDIPHWPQLPQRSEKEHFVYQFLQPLVACNMLIFEDDRWIFDTSRSKNAECMTDFYTTCLPAETGDAECLDTFLPFPETAAGFHAFYARAQATRRDDAIYMKGQIAGPLTIALELKDQQGKAAYYDGDLRDILVRTLALNARSQAAALGEFGHQPIIFIDDPVISACGSHLHLSLSREMVLEDLDIICAAIESEGAIPGIHACEAIDWSLVMESKARILSLDAYRFGPSLMPYAKPLCDYIKHGGVIAWGIVPTLDDPFRESVESLMGRLERLWDTLFPKSMDRAFIIQQGMITPACGTGLLSPLQAQHIYRLTADLSDHIRNIR